MSNIEIAQQDYEAFRVFLEEACGIVLGENKQYLISSRLGRLMKEQEIPSLGALVAKLKAGADHRFRDRIIDAMTTNETSWFRDSYPFEALGQIIFPERAKLSKHLRIWSAACSSGQEPYSISMAVQEYMIHRPGTLSEVQILATDISPTILKSAQAGIYDGPSVARGLSDSRKKLFFQVDAGGWRVRDIIRERINFREINLMNNFVGLGKFDCIFCRNVLIYFSNEIKLDIIRRLTQALKPQGYLILGGSESIASYSSEFETVRGKSGIIYRKKAGPRPGR